MASEAQPAQVKSQAASRPVDFVKKVGKGKTLSQPLTHSESREAFTALLDGAFTNAQAGAFLQALRINELSQDELDALAGIFRDRTALQLPLAGAKTLALNLSSDTGRKGGLASLLAAQLLRRFDVGVGLVRSTPVLSGNRASFDATWVLCESLDSVLPVLPAPPALPAQGPMAAAPKLTDCGALVRGLSALDGLRGELGFRSCLHTAEKLVNPWPDSPLLLGLSHKHYALRMAATMGTLGIRGRILLGNHGTVDLVLHKETEMVSVDAQGIREESVSPAELGLEIPSDIYSLGKFVEWNGWLEAARDPEKRRDNGLLRAVQYHAAVFLWAAGAVPDAAAGLAEVRRVIPGLS